MTDVVHGDTSVCPGLSEVVMCDEVSLEVVLSAVWSSSAYVHCYASSCDLCSLFVVSFVDRKG